MGLAAELKSDDPEKIKATLISLFNSITDEEILALDQAYHVANNKVSFLMEFEASSASVSLKNPVVLEKWTHYRWIRLELTNIAYMQAALNKIALMEEKSQSPISDTNYAVKPSVIPLLPAIVKKVYENDTRAVDIKDRGIPFKKFQESIADPFIENELAFKPTVTESIASAIQEDYLNGVPIEKSISVVRKIMLQVVGTEHPTDPLSQNARDTFDQIAQVIDSDDVNESNLINLLKNLQRTDSIPPSRRQVVDEINRNIQITLDRLYAGLPRFIESILSAYKNFYGEKLYTENENIIFEALEGHTSSIGEGASQIERDASWAGFDADGNINITPKTMKHAIGLYRIRAAEKHIETLTTQIIPLCDEIRDKLESDKKFESDDILKQLSAFSSTDPTQPGDIQKLQNIFKEYKQSIINSVDDFKIKNKNADLCSPTEYIIQWYKEFLGTHSELLNVFPILKKRARIFSVQLHCFGMTYGLGHIRQDSSEYGLAWEIILENLKKEPNFIEFNIFKLMNGRSYCQLTNQERISLHKQFYTTSKTGEKTEGAQLLEHIYYKYRTGEYYSNMVAVHNEIERLNIMIDHKDMFEDVIISNSENAANIFEVESLLRIFPDQHHSLTIVPLLEKREDLKNFESILTDFIKLKIQIKIEELFDSSENNKNTICHLLNIKSKFEIKDFLENKNRTDFKHLLISAPIWLRDHLQMTNIEIMVGFSDTERVSGLTALIPVQLVQEDFVELVRDFGMNPKIFHGPGGDINRGGLGRRDLKSTLQGNARSTILSSSGMMQRYHETRFYQAYKMGSRVVTKEIKNLPQHIQILLLDFEKNGAKYYEFLHDKINGLGNLYGFMLGHGVHWLVNIMNSSSRATQRGKHDEIADRTASVQTGGVRPENYIDPDKPRAITATQMKEMLRDNVNVIFGPGYALRLLGVENAALLYQCSGTFRDMVEKTILGVAMSDYSIAAHAYFISHPELIAKNSVEKKSWSEECRLNYPHLLKNIHIKEYLLTEEGRSKLRVMMSRLFAFLEDERDQTLEFLLKLNQVLHPDSYPPNTAITEETKPTDLLMHKITLHRQAIDMIEEVTPLSLLLARQNHFIINGKNLDQVYIGLNENNIFSSKLTGIGRLLGNLGAGITAFRIMMVNFYEPIYAKHDMRVKASRLRLEMDKSEFKSMGNFRLFDNRENLNLCFKKCDVAKVKNKLIYTS